jgi:hypothetical protein
MGGKLGRVRGKEGGIKGRRKVLDGMVRDVRCSCISGCWMNKVGCWFL